MRRQTAVRITREPEFDDYEAALLAAWHEVKRETNSLGFPIDEALSIDSDVNNPQNVRAYKVHATYVDHAVKAQLDAQDAYRKQNPEASMNGLIFPVDVITRQ